LHILKEEKLKLSTW